MDACIAVDREIEKVLSKFGDIQKDSNDGLQELIDSLETMKNGLENNDENNKPTIAQIKELVNKAKDETQKIATEHRELHSTVSKVGKAIDRNFISDFDVTTTHEDVFAEPENAEYINKIICQHFYRQGMSEMADEFIKESGITMEPSVSEPLAKLHAIKKSLQNKETRLALEWAKENRAQLETHMYPPYPLVKRVSSASHIPVRIPYHVKRSKFNCGVMKPRPKTKKIKRMELAKKILHQFYKSSSLEFKLHQIEFLTLVQQGVDHQIEAVAYARANFGQFSAQHEKDIQSMMGMLLYIPQGINKSPYSGILLENLWSEVSELFTRDACSLLGLTYDSFLDVSINAGCAAIPALLNIKNVMKQRKVDCLWKGKEELPIEINLDAEHRYHSMFACPILRQQSSTANPPMKLVCGHVISKDALQKLGTTHKFKCPYCPVEQSTSEAKLITF